MHLETDDWLVLDHEAESVQPIRLLPKKRPRKTWLVSIDWPMLQASIVASVGPLLERVLPVAILGVAVVAVPMLVFQNEGLPRMRSLQRELADVTRENAELRRDIGRLKAEVRDLRDDPTAVERIARDQLGLVRKSEVVFQFGKAK